jgi:hypothetical protein
MIQVDTLYELSRQHRQQLQAEAEYAGVAASSQMRSDASRRSIGFVAGISRLTRAALAAPATQRAYRRLSHV